MGEDCGFGAAVAGDNRTIGVYVDDDITAFYRTDKPITIDAWHEILCRHFEASLNLPPPEADGWMAGAFLEVYREYGGGRFQTPQAIRPSSSVSASVGWARGANLEGEA